MELLRKKEILGRLSRCDEHSLFIDPLLDENQVGEVSVDLRLGTEFLVSILTRKPYIALRKGDDTFRGMQSYFRQTRRDIGDGFVLYPNQIVLGSTLEYIGLPSDVYADIVSRSSYLRLGVSISSMIQPGYRGCFPLELTNYGNNPIELIVGSRVIQARLFAVGDAGSYAQQPEKRKYIGNVRPVTSLAAEDEDLRRLSRIFHRR